VPRGDDYEAQIKARLRGQNPHGEVDFVEDLLSRTCAEGGQPPLILDGGCGTGRVAVELARRGHSVIGADNDPQMLAVARRKNPTIPWLLADLADVQLDAPLTVIVLAGNVIIFLDSGQEGVVLRNLSQQLQPDGLLVAGFQLGAGRIGLKEYDGLATAAGLRLLERWATWDRAAWNPGADYAVSVHQRHAVANVSTRPGPWHTMAGEHSRSNTCIDNKDLEWWQDVAWPKGRSKP
jgi:SAM-dependent methyltransferase